MLTEEAGTNRIGKESTMQAFAERPKDTPNRFARKATVLNRSGRQFAGMNVAVDLALLYCEDSGHRSKLPHGS